MLCYVLIMSSRCPIFRQEACVMSSSAVKIFHLSAGTMLCVVLCLSRCPIFRQYPVKMSHLSAGSMLCVVLCPQVLSRCPIFRQEACVMSSSAQSKKKHQESVMSLFSLDTDDYQGVLMMDLLQSTGIHL